MEIGEKQRDIERYRNVGVWGNMEMWGYRDTEMQVGREIGR